jgi:Fe-S-cluster-containing dehydrogenase component/DMSO reductase anchor subunit
MTALEPIETFTLIDELLAEQQRLTAVERFALRHDQHALPARRTLYRELLPTSAPAEGEQYAFAVDLDSCSGCKACVTACHNLNGLDEDETWRSVGLLHGRADDGISFQQTVTTACHHCVEPACLEGCPVLAYEKDPDTGIVRHLDDQCIGCQYCVLKCPYDVPKYSARRGIVRKCDMCASRLAVGEPPACAQAGPNGAIQITVVNKAAVVAEARKGNFLPGAPAPGYTQPTTRYTSARGLPLDLVPADEHELKPAHSHPPLVAMLVLTQLSVGAFCVETLLRALFPANLMTQISPLHSVVALALGLLALGASTLHLGRPRYAWRAFIGWRRSWLSREIIVFAVFALLATLQGAGFALAPLSRFDSVGVGAAISLSGLLGVYCSVMVYQDTRRQFWRGGPTAVKFLCTSLLLGAAVILFATSLQGLLFPAVAGHGAYHELTGWLTGTLIAASVVKLCAEAGVLRHLRDPHRSEMKGTARLLTGELSEIATARVLFGLIGGVVLPLAFLVRAPLPGFATLGVTLWIILFTAVGEFLERYLFFVSVVPPRMPGGIGS